jgi:hypothetical protein
MSKPFVPTREQIQQADDFQTRQVPVPEWGDGAVVYVRTISSADRIKFEMSLQHDNERIREKRREQVKEKLIVLCACDADGSPLFQESDINWLRGKSARPIERIFEAARVLNGIGEDDVEQLVGNSQEVQSDDLRTD